MINILHNAMLCSKRDPYDQTALTFTAVTDSTISFEITNEYYDGLQYRTKYSEYNDYRSKTSISLAAGEYVQFTNNTINPSILIATDNPIGKFNIKSGRINASR
jgi:hypothetical protein